MAKKVSGREDALARSTGAGPRGSTSKEALIKYCEKGSQSYTEVDATGAFRLAQRRRQITGVPRLALLLCTTTTSDLDGL